MTQEKKQPEKKVISKVWKTFMIFGMIVYLTAMAYVGYFLDGKVDASALSRMSVILGGGIGMTVLSFKKNNMKW